MKTPKFKKASSCTHQISVGDKVKFSDNSYVMEVMGQEGIKQGYPVEFGVSTGILIARDCILPCTGFLGKKRVNDAIVVADDGKTYFCKLAICLNKI